MSEGAPYSEPDAPEEEVYFPPGYFARVAELEKEMSRAYLEPGRNYEELSRIFLPRTQALEEEADLFLLTLVEPYTSDAPVDQQAFVGEEDDRRRVGFTEAEVEAVRNARNMHTAIVEFGKGEIGKDYRRRPLVFPSDVHLGGQYNPRSPSLEHRPDAVLALFEIARAAESCMNRSKHSVFGPENTEFPMFRYLMDTPKKLVKHPPRPQKSTSNS